MSPLPDCPADLVLLIDTSASMLEDLRRARDATVQFAEALQKASVGFYAISFAHHLGSGKRRDYGASTLKTLSDSTGASWSTAARWI